MNTDDQPMDIDIDININTSLQPSPPTSINWVRPPSHAESNTGLYDLYTDPEGLWVIHRWKSTPGARIEPFYERWPPSRTSMRGCVWIAINRGISPDLRALGKEAYENKFKRDVEGLKREFAQIIVGEGGAGAGAGGTGIGASEGSVVGSPGKVTPEMIDALAVKYGVLSGKWLVYAKPDRVDELWRKIVGVIAFERKHGQAKVSARKVIEDPDFPPLPPRSPPSDEEAEKWNGGVPESSEGHVICVYVDDYTNKQDVDELRKVLRFRARVFWKIGFKSDAYTHLGIYKGNAWGLRPSRYHDADYNKGGDGFGRRLSQN